MQPVRVYLLAQRSRLNVGGDNFRHNLTARAKRQGAKALDEFEERAESKLTEKLEGNGHQVDY